MPKDNACKPGPEVRYKPVKIANQNPLILLTPDIALHLATTTFINLIQGCIVIGKDPQPVILAINPPTGFISVHIS
jgi:hypothetical protein